MPIRSKRSRIGNSPHDLIHQSRFEFASPPKFSQERSCLEFSTANSRKADGRSALTAVLEVLAVTRALAEPLLVLFR